MLVLKDQFGNEFFPQAGGVYVVDINGEIVYLTIEKREEYYLQSN
jgi:hypothetical protein